MSWSCPFHSFQLPLHVPVILSVCPLDFPCMSRSFVSFPYISRRADWFPCALFPFHSPCTPLVPFSSPLFPFHFPLLSYHFLPSFPCTVFPSFSRGIQAWDPCSPLLYLRLRRRAGGVRGGGILYPLLGVRQSDTPSNVGGYLYVHTYIHIYVCFLFYELHITGEWQQLDKHGSATRPFRKQTADSSMFRPLAQPRALFCNRQTVALLRALHGTTLKRLWYNRLCTFGGSASKIPRFVMLYRLTK